MMLELNTLWRKRIHSIEIMTKIKGIPLCILKVVYFIAFIYIIEISCKFVKKSISLFMIVIFWHDVGGPLSRRSLCLFWRETKQMPELKISTRPEVGKGTPVWSSKKEPTGGSWRKVTQKGSRHRTAEETSRHEIESSSSEGRPVKMSQHSSWLVEIS